MKTTGIIFSFAGAMLASAAHAAQPLQVDSRLNVANPSPPLSSMLSLVAGQARAGSHRVLPRHVLTPQMKPGAPASAARGAPPASALQTGGAVTQSVLTTLSINQDGIASNDLIAPPDPNGAVGDTQYVQWVNVRFAIYDKKNGGLLLGPLPGSAVFAGMSGSAGAQACANGEGSDPIIQYDKQAKRWIHTLIAWDPANFYTGPYYQCIAVSTTSDATGSYYRYTWDMRDANDQPVLPDYPKLGVWPDAFYFTWVLFPPIAQEGYLGPRACGVERGALLAGKSPLVRCKDFGTTYGPVLPSDLDGTMAPPAGSPNYLLSLDYNADGSGDHLFMWRLSFASATVSDAITIPVAPFTIACPNEFGGPCIQQPAPGETLDALGDRLMYRLAYRNFGDREALVANHSVQQPGAAADGPVGVRWYELRNLRTTPGVYQQGTWAPDGNSRWMASIAMDRMGNIALGYNVSGPTVFPGVRYSGRLRSEPLGRLEPEAVVVAGGGVQVNTGGRWGDYSSMSIDPAGDCKFWTTQEYIAQTGVATWHTRIADFNFRNCQ